MQSPFPGFYSHCTEREDYILARLLADIDKGFYVDVGACLPTNCSVTKYFYDRLWSGVNIEPLPDYFAALCYERPRDINLNTGISNTHGKSLFHVCGGMSTLNAETASIVSQKGQGSFQQLEISLCPLTDVFDAYVGSRDVHFLKIDVETHEREVIESMDFKKYTPWVLCIESTFPNTMDPLHQDWEHLLIEAGYQFVLQHDVNRFYVHYRHYAQRVHVFENHDFVVVSA